MLHVIEKYVIYVMTYFDSSFVLTIHIVNMMLFCFTLQKFQHELISTLINNNIVHDFHFLFIPSWPFIT